MSRLLSKLGSLINASGRVATIDSVRAAPPPSPLAPIDLTDPSQIAGVMEIGARIGDILLSSGTANKDAKSHIHAVTSAYGLHYCHVDITMNTITMYANIGATRKEPVVVFRVVRGLDTNFSKLSEVERLIRSIQAGATSPELAENILDELENKPAKYGAKTATIGWGVFGGAVTLTLGGGPLAVLVAGIMSLVIMALSTYLGRNGLPGFFSNMLGGFLATVPAALLYSVAGQFNIQISPSQIIASGIVVLVAGLGLVQSLQDGIQGASVTASARFFNTMLMTGAIVAGVAVGIQFSAAMGIALPPLEAEAPANFATLAAQVFGAGIISAGFAIAMYAQTPAVVVSGLTALFGMSFYHLLFLPLGLGTVASTALTTSIIGLAGGLMARRFLVPPVITAIAGISPMLPGLMLYRAMYALLEDQILIGLTNLFVALAIAGALAGGVVLGEWVARRIRRPSTFRPYTAFRAVSRHTFQRLARPPRPPRTPRGPRRIRRRGTPPRG